MMSTKAGLVLVIDDNLSFADNIAEILQIDGWDTDVAASGEEALSKALEREPSIVLTDYRLPGMNGVDFVKRYRVEHPNVLAVVISACEDEGMIRSAMGIGAPILPKPLDLAALSRLICPGEGSS